MSDTYFAAAKMNTMLAMVRDGVRDLTSPALKPYWDGMLDVAPGDNYKESAEFRAANDLPSIGAATFASQMSRSSGQQTFINYLNEVGVESVYTEDVTEEELGPILPDLGVLTEVVQRLEAKGYAPDAKALAARFRGVALPGETQIVLHLDEPLPTNWADEDSHVAARLARARAYLDAYLGDV